MGAVEVIVVEVEWEAGGAVVTGVVGAGVGPFAGEGLDEAFGLAVGLGAIGFGEEMLETELEAGGGKEFGAVGGAAIGEDGLDGDAVGLVKVEGLMEGGEDAGDFFIGKEGGKSEAGMVIDGDVEGFNACTWVAVGTVAGGADAGVEKAAKLFNIKMKELARSGAFVTDDGRFGRFEPTQAVEAVTLKDAGEGSFGDGENHEDLSIGTALTAEGEDLIFQVSGSLARLMAWDGGMIFQASWEVSNFSTSEPFADGLFTDAERVGGGAQGRATREVMLNQFGSHDASEYGISVHVVRVG